MGTADLALLAAILGLSAYVLHANAGRALLCLKPESLRLEPEAPGDQTRVPEVLAPLARELTEQGFVLLGCHSESSRLRPPTWVFDFGFSGDGTYASLSESPNGDRLLTFLTWTEEGPFLLTANHRRPVREQPGHYQSSYLENTTAARLFKAHSRRLEGRKGRGPLSLDGRMEAARAWLAGPGRAEIRQQHLSGLLWTVSAMGLVAGLAFART